MATCESGILSRFGLWRMRRHVQASRKRLREGRGDLLDELMVRGWDDPDALALVAKEMAEVGVTAQQAVDAIAAVARHLPSPELKR